MTDPRLPGESQPDSGPAAVPDGPSEIEEAARQELEYPEDETDEG